MKVFLCLALFATAAFAEPPSYRQKYFIARQRQQEETTAAAAPYAPSGWKPDGPAFNLPQRNERQQQQQESQVDNGYGPPPEPQQQYGAPAAPPQQQYGAPSQAAPARQRGSPSFQSQRFTPPQQFRGQAGRQQPPQQQYGAPNPQTEYGAPDFTTTEAAVTEVDEPVTVGGLEGAETEQSGGLNELEGEDGEIEVGQPKDADSQQRGEYYVALPDGRLQRVRYVSRQDLEAMRYFAKIRAENVEPLRGPIYAYSPLQKLEVAPGNLQVAVGPAPAPATLAVTASESRPQKLVQRQPQVDVKPLAQLQIQHDNQVLPLGSGFNGYTASYQVPAAPAEDRFILAFP